MQKICGLHSRMVSKEEKKLKSSNFVHVNKVLSSLGKKKNADKSINPVKKFEKVSMPNLISAQHMRPVRELLKKWLSSLDFFAVHCCKVVTITLSCIFQRLKYWFYPFTYLSFSHKEWRRLSEDKTPRETFLWENTSNVCLKKNLDKL